ncbi:MAG: YkgJ family cysteine cluster protein [Desulfopila sp.]
MKFPVLPKNMVAIGQNEPFVFDCHKGVDCFTHCCRQLDLALAPYDVLRLKNALGMHSAQFLDNYVIIEREDGEVFPRFYLTMVDDGNASCVFVTKDGCSLYPDRPGACRAYPMGRASMRQPDGSIEDQYVLLNEEHCHGFAESGKQTPLEYSRQQGFDKYNSINDVLIPVLQHEKIRDGMQLNEQQVALFTLALYDLDTFRDKLFSAALDAAPPDAAEQERLNDDEALLLFAVTWLKSELFKDTTDASG